MKHINRIFAFALCLIMAIACIPAAFAESRDDADQIVRCEEPEAPMDDSEALPFDPESMEIPLKEGGREAADVQFKYTGPVTEGNAVTDYSYEVYPILTPFVYYIYVKTDNPDPLSFRLVDKESRFFGPDDKGQIAEWTARSSWYMTTECNPGTFYFSNKTFSDVVYENRDTRRVAGGYIFETRKAFSDGGELVLQRITKRDDSLLWCKYEDTDVKVPCQPLTTYLDYLIDTYIDPSKPLFDNLDALQQALDEIGVYPMGLFDTDKPNRNHPYPYIASSIYPEHPLMSGCQIYESSSEWLLATEVYPYILSSVSFPGVIWLAAERLEPDVEIRNNPDYHWLIDVTYQGQTKSYGGAGKGNGDSLENRRVEKRFAFDGSANDLAVRGAMQAYYDLLVKYQRIATEDLQAWYDLVSGETYRQTIRATGGTWIRLAVTTNVADYGYVIPLGSGVRQASEAWVDGKYIDNYEHVVYGERFEDHPTADIILHDVSYTDHDGNPHCQDVLYSYDSKTDTWSAGFFYANAFWYSLGWTIPDELILTREEAEEAIREMNIPVNGIRVPEHGLIYDGKSYPGTPFRNVPVTGVILPETCEAVVGSEENTIQVTMIPENATCRNVKWESSDPDIVTGCSSVDGDRCLLIAKKPGTATLTCTTMDGGYQASCVVTVLPNVTFPEQPQSQTAEEGETVRFHVTVNVRTTSVDNLRFLWQCRREGGDWFYIGGSGSDTDTLTLKASMFYNGARFRCRIDGVSGINATSDEATLTVKPREIGTVEFAQGEVQYKGDTPYVIDYGRAWAPRVVVKDRNGNVVDKSLYTVTYRDNTRAGTAYVDVRMNGSDTVTTLFFKIYMPATTETKVVNAKNGIRIRWEAVPNAKGYVIYRRAWSSTTNGWTDFLRWNNTTETTWTDTQVYAGTRYQYGVKAYFAEREGADGTMIGGAMDNYNLGVVGPLKTTVRITTRTLNSVTAGTKQLTAKWSASKNFTGYQVQIATDAKFTQNRQTFTIDNAQMTSYTVRSLKAKTTYYVRVRSYTVFEGTTYYGGWSNVRNVKTK